MNDDVRGGLHDVTVALADAALAYTNLGRRISGPPWSPRLFALARERLAQREQIVELARAEGDGAIGRLAEPPLMVHEGVDVLEVFEHFEKAIDERILDALALPLSPKLRTFLLRLRADLERSGFETRALRYESRP